MPLYRRSKLPAVLQEVCGFRTDYQFIIRKNEGNPKMEILKKSVLKAFNNTNTACSYCINQQEQ
jgi:hypothetical protein